MGGMETLQVPLTLEGWRPCSPPYPGKDRMQARTLTLGRMETLQARSCLASMSSSFLSMSTSTTLSTAGCGAILA